MSAITAQMNIEDIVPGFQNMKFEAMRDTLIDALMAVVAPETQALTLFRARGRKLREAAILGEKAGSIDVLREAFAGSAAMTREIVDSGKAASAVIGEANPYARNIYQQLKDNSQNVIKDVEDLANQYWNLPQAQRSAFIKGLQKGASKELGASRAAEDIVMGQFSSRYIPGKSPVPPFFGKYAKPSGIVNKLEVAADAFQKTKIYPDWQKAIQGAGKHDLVLFDPPYLGKNSNYNVPEFSREMLAEVIKKLKESKIPTIVWDTKKGMKQLGLTGKQTFRSFDEQVSGFSISEEILESLARGKP